MGTMTDEAKALVEWFDKTKWVQDSVQPHELGLHRADVLRNRIETQARKIERLNAILSELNDTDKIMANAPHWERSNDK